MPARSVRATVAAVVMVLVGYAVLDAVPGRSRSSVLADFEHGTLGRFTAQESSADRITVVRDVGGTGGALQGDRSAQIRCGPRDQGVAGAGRAWRTELRASSNDTRARPGHTQRWEWYMRIGADLLPPQNRRGWVVLAQFHSGIDGTSPQLALELSPSDTLVLRARGGDPDDPAVSSAALVDVLERERTYRIEQEIHWSTGGAGRVTTWIDGQLRAVHEGANAYVGARAYLKLGCYRSDSDAGDGTMWVDDVQRREVHAVAGLGRRVAAVGALAIAGLGAVVFLWRGGRWRGTVDDAMATAPAAGGHPREARRLHGGRRG